MDNIKAALELIAGALSWTKDEWTIFLTGFLIGGFLIGFVMSLLQRIRTRPSLEQKRQIEFEKQKSKLNRTLSKLKIKPANRNIRIWDDDIKRRPVHVKIKSEQTCRVILPDGNEEVVPTGQLSYMNNDK